MNKRTPEMNRDFSISARQDETQKLSLEIQKLRDEEARDRIQGMEAKRKEQLKVEKEQAQRREELMVQRELDKRERGKNELHLTMKNAPKMTRNQLEKQVRSDVRNSHGVSMDKVQQELKQALNQEISKELKKAQKQERRQDQKQEQKKDRQQGKVAQFQENKQTVTNEKPRRPWERNDRGNQKARPWERNISGRAGPERKRDR